MEFRGWGYRHQQCEFRPAHRRRQSGPKIYVYRAIELLVRTYYHSGKTGFFMQKSKRAGMVVPLLLAVMLCSSIPAFAQIDLTGLWAPRTGDEDNPERLAGPSLVEYLGLPI